VTSCHALKITALFSLFFASTKYFVLISRILGYTIANDLKKKFYAISYAYQESGKFNIILVFRMEDENGRI
jgi:hypothetical protein